MASGKVQAKSGMGVMVSSMLPPDDDLDDAQKTIFDWCIDGDVTKVAHILATDKDCINQKDENVGHKVSKLSFLLYSNCTTIISHLIAAAIILNLKFEP